MEWIPIVLIVFSLVCVILFLMGRIRQIRSYSMGPSDLDRQTWYDSAPVQVVYEDSEKPMLLHFHVDKLVLEREETQRLDIPHTLVVGVTCRNSEDGRFAYEVCFRPEETEAKDTIRILSERDLTDPFEKLLPKEKITKE